jgi:hypothetical protein
MLLEVVITQKFGESAFEKRQMEEQKKKFFSIVLKLSLRVFDNLIFNGIHLQLSFHNHFSFGLNLKIIL